MSMDVRCALVYVAQEVHVSLMSEVPNLPTDKQVMSCTLPNSVAALKERKNIHVLFRIISNIIVGTWQYIFHVTVTA